MDYILHNIQITNLCRITICNERRINRVNLKFLFILTAKIVRAEKNSILQPLLICISKRLCKHYTVKKFKYRFHEIISTEWLTSLSTSIKFKYCIIKRISHYSTDAPGQRPQVNVAYSSIERQCHKKHKKIKCSRQ